MQSPLEFDVIIAGGGLTGASLALALAAGAGRIALIEAVPPASDSQPSYDDRGLALALSTQRILQALGVWEAVSPATPIEHIHVSDQHHFGVVRLHAEELRMPALGYVVLARALGNALMEKVNSTPAIEFICPARVTGVVAAPGQTEVTLVRDGRESTITGRLLVAADGTSSRLREILGISTILKDYHQTAIVTNVTPDRAHDNTAWERFTKDGPVALLPLADNRCSVVFTVCSADTERYLAMDEDDFLSCLKSRFSTRLGSFRRLGARKSWPLQYLLATEQVRERAVLLGNTAHTLHPNGAQGFNLCLRDVAELAEVLTPVLRTGGDPGALPLLQSYQAKRTADQKRVACFSDGLATLFYTDLPHKVLFRNFGMLFLNLCPPWKRSLARMGTGLYGKQPALVRGAL
jgi:2-octaprenyl-6-methoxyphenol hydroxylase